MSFTRYNELKDCYELIISFTTGRDFCTMFSVNKKFYEICNKLKKDIIITFTGLSYKLPHCIRTGINNINHHSLDSLWWTRNSTFDKITINKTYNNIKINDIWHDTTKKDKNRTIQINYYRGEASELLYYLDDISNPKYFSVDRYEANFTNKTLSKYDNGRLYMKYDNYHFYNFISDYKIYISYLYFFHKLIL